MSADILQVLLLLRNQVKLYHWQTFEYARHKATDDIVASLDDNIDKFTEVYMGKYGRPHFTTKNSSFKLHDTTDKKALPILNECVKWLTNELPKKLKKTDTDLLNIRDEILADINKARYLFTLK
jgi:DNA-binding ferritin-like protein